MIRSIATAVVLSVMLAAPFAGAAHAESFEPAQLTVRTDNVDFNDARQVKGLYRKLQAAAHRVCAGDTSHPLAIMETEACEASAVSDAVRQINAPQLSALDGQNGRAETFAEMPRAARAN